MPAAKTTLSAPRRLTGRDKRSGFFFMNPNFPPLPGARVTDNRVQSIAIVFKFTPLVQVTSSLMGIKMKYERYGPSHHLLPFTTLVMRIAGLVPGLVPWRVSRVSSSSATLEPKRLPIARHIGTRREGYDAQPNSLDCPRNRTGEFPVPGSLTFPFLKVSAK